MLGTAVSAEDFARSSSAGGLSRDRTYSKENKVENSDVPPGACIHIAPQRVYKISLFAQKCTRHVPNFSAGIEQETARYTPRVYWSISTSPFVLDACTEVRSAKCKTGCRRQHNSVYELLSVSSCSQRSNRFVRLCPAI